jgi:serine protease inhibitor
MARFTRVLILVGVMSLAAACDSIIGEANRLLAAEAGKGPQNYAVTANGDFALDLYKQLAKEKPGKNLFFSPYSMSIALAMTAEGARGETAEQMGRVLRYPEAARRGGDDAQAMPWNVSLIHAGMAELNKRLTATNPNTKKIREEIARLRKELDAANAHDSGAGGPMGDWETVKKAQRLARALNNLLAQVDQYELNVANALWIERTYPIQQSYLETIHRFYSTGGAFPVDFANTPEPTRQKLNAWVEEETRRRIKDLLPQGSVDSLTRVVLSNAIYFKGEWAEIFKESETKEDDFLLPGRAKVRVPMMHDNDHNSAGYAAFNSDGMLFRTPATIRSDEDEESLRFYPDKHGFLMLEMYYKGGELSMVVIVPQSADGLPALERSLTPPNVQSWIAKLERRSVNVSMPKFRMETGYDMNDTLRAMGMTRAFVGPAAGADRGAQFDGISGGDDPAQRLYIGVVMHKAFVMVNEQGTEAAAATGVPGVGWSPEVVPFTPAFRANKPFVFLIRDRHTGCILFLGRMTNPKAP